MARTPTPEMHRWLDEFTDTDSRAPLLRELAGLVQQLAASAAADPARGRAQARLC